MSTSRRKFLKAGLLTALGAAVPLGNVLGQSRKDRQTNPGKVPGAQSDPLAHYSKATFTSYLNSIFQIDTVTGVVEVALLQVGDMPAPKGGECFSLLFRGGSQALPQDTYTLVHASLGTFQLLLVPTGADEYGAQGYLATINRLSHADAANRTAPTKPLRSAQPAAPTNSSTGPKETAPKETPNPVKKGKPAGASKLPLE